MNFSRKEGQIVLHPLLPDLSTLPGAPPNGSGKRWKGEISIGNNWKEFRGLEPFMSLVI